MSPLGDFYASTGSSGTVKINTASPSNFGETVDTLAPRTDSRNKFGMHVVYVRKVLSSLWPTPLIIDNALPEP
jgi:hypothetical protein